MRSQEVTIWGKGCSAISLPSRSKIRRISTSTPRSLSGLIPARCKASRNSAWVTIPAPRPASSAPERSKISAWQPARRSNSPANRPLIEPPIIRARPRLVTMLPRRFVPVYHSRHSTGERHGPQHEGKASRSLGGGVAQLDRRGIREKPAKRLRRHSPVVGGRSRAGVGHSPQARRAHRLSSPPARLFLDRYYARPRALAPAGRLDGRNGILCRRDAARELPRRRVQ